MGVACTKIQAVTQEEADEKAQDADIRKRIKLEAKMEKKVYKLLLLGAGESGKSTVFKQIKFLFQMDLTESEINSYVPVIHANVYQSIRTLFIGCKEFADSGQENSSNYVLQPENQEFGEMLAEIENPEEFPPLNEENALRVQSCWNDPAIQAAFRRGNELQIPDCTRFFLNEVRELAGEDYTPSEEHILFARQQTRGIVEIEFSPKKGESYKLFDVGGQRNERRKWMHLFDGVTAIIFCAALSEYDQMLLEDDQKNRTMETKELFEWLLKQPWFENTSFLVFLNKFDLFKDKVLEVPLSVCDWFRDYQPITADHREIDHAYKFVEQKFQEIYNQSTPSSNLKRLFKVYKTTAIDKAIMKKTFDLVEHTLHMQRLHRAKLL